MFLFINSLFKKYPSTLIYKPGIEFLARLFFIGMFIFLLKKIYNFFADEGGVIHSSILGSFSPIEWLRHLLLNNTKAILEILGYKPYLYGWVVGADGGGIVIETPCLGINVCFVFITLIIAFPSKIKWFLKAFYIIIGVLLIQAFNLARMVGMVFVVKNKYHLPIEHHDLFNIIIYLLVIILFYYYVNKS